MATQWTFAFLGGRFDGYRHVADPRQIGPFQAPPEELHLWEDEDAKRIYIREEGDAEIDTTAERYCLRSANRKRLEARYEHEHVYADPHLRAEADVPLREELERAVPEPAAA